MPLVPGLCQDTSFCYIFFSHGLGLHFRVAGSVKCPCHLARHRGGWLLVIAWHLLEPVTYWLMKTSYQVGKVGDISTASQQLSCCITVHDSMGSALSFLKTADILGLIWLDDRKTIDPCKINATGCANWIFGLKLENLLIKSISLWWSVQNLELRVNYIEVREKLAEFIDLQTGCSCVFSFKVHFYSVSYICVFCILSESSCHLVSWSFILKVHLRQGRKEIPTNQISCSQHFHLAGTAFWLFCESHGFKLANFEFLIQYSLKSWTGHCCTEMY